jgi:hypothetical protein
MVVRNSEGFNKKAQKLQCPMSPAYAHYLNRPHSSVDCDPRDNIVRVYACLGEERTPVEEWLAACLRYTLVYNQQGGMTGSWTSSHTDLIQQCKDKGITVHEWMDSASQNGSQDRRRTD